MSSRGFAQTGPIWLSRSLRNKLWKPPRLCIEQADANSLNGELSYNSGSLSVPNTTSGCFLALRGGVMTRSLFLLIVSIGIPKTLSLT
jgi:hypothetical protein